MLSPRASRRTAAGAGGRSRAAPVPADVRVDPGPDVAHPIAPHPRRHDDAGDPGPADREPAAPEEPRHVLDAHERVVGELGERGRGRASARTLAVETHHRAPTRRPTRRPVLMSVSTRCEGRRSQYAATESGTQNGRLRAGASIAGRACDGSRTALGSWCTLFPPAPPGLTAGGAVCFPNPGRGAQAPPYPPSAAQAASGDPGELSHPADRRSPRAARGRSRAPRTR